MFIERAPPQGAVPRAANQRNPKSPFAPQRRQSPRDSTGGREQPKYRTAASSHQGRRGSRPNQFLLDCGNPAVLLENHRLKIVRWSFTCALVPDLRQETKYFILFGFGSQTRAEVTVGL